MTLKNSEVAFLFAKGYADGNNKHMFIEEDTIFSYGHHFPIAKKLTNEIVLFNTVGYSSTTAHHKHLVYSALSGSYTIIFLPDCDIEKAHLQLGINKERIVLFKEKLKKARTRHKYYESGIRNYEEQNKLIEEKIFPYLIAVKI